MDDKFLYLLREQPDPVFMAGLNQKLTQGQLGPKGESHRLFTSPFLPQRAIYGWILALAIVIALAMSMISPVKAYLSPIILKLTGQTFIITDDYPGDDHLGQETTIEPQIMSLEEALAIFPDPITLPGKLPPGYTIDEQAIRVYVGEDAGPFANTIEMSLSNAEAKFHLNITDRDLGSGEIVAPDSVEEILLDGDHTAYVIHGGWDSDHKVWDHDQPGVRLRWSVNNLTYDLQGRNLQRLIEIAMLTLE